MGSLQISVAQELSRTVGKVLYALPSLTHYIVNDDHETSYLTLLPPPSQVLSFTGMHHHLYTGLEGNPVTHA